MTSKTPATAAAVRAAQAWADLTDDQLAAAIGVSKRTLSRLKTGAEVSLERQHAIAEATGVPTWFMDSGFEGAVAPDEPALAERVEALEAKLQTALGLARARDERVSTLEDQLETVAQLTERLASLEGVLEPIIDLAGERTAGDLANDAERREPDETGGSWDGEDRRRPGQGSARR